jgi:hypothetical protein
MSRIISFQYIVSGGDLSYDLDYKGTSALVLNGGQIQTTSSSENANLTLPTPTSANSLSYNKNIEIGTFSISSSGSYLQNINTSISGISSKVLNGNISLKNIDVSSNGSILKTGSVNVNLQNLNANVVSNNLTEYPLVVFNPTKIESLTTYNGSSVHVSATVSFEYPITSAAGLFSNLNSTLFNYNQVNDYMYTLEILIPQTGMFTLTAGGYAVDLYRQRSYNLNVVVNLNETPKRYLTKKNINLTNLLPTHLEYSETGEFVEVFENYLNEMYFEYENLRTDDYTFTKNSEGDKTYYKTSADTNGDDILVSPGVSGTNLIPYKYNVQEIPKISILEKIKRLSDLHDPDLIDIAYINSLANYLGYDINIFKNNLPNSEISDYDANRYLRFIVSNLPHWNRIKCTKNAIKILLYSFGLVGDLLERWTSDDLSSSIYHPTSGGYSNDITKWSYENESSNLTNIYNNIQDIPENYFPTSHFKIVVSQVASRDVWINQIPNIIHAIEGIRPINTVLEDVVVMFYGGITTIEVVNGTIRKEIIYAPQNTVMNDESYIYDALYLSTRDTSTWTEGNGKIYDSGNLTSRTVVIEHDAGNLETRNFYD